VTDQEKIAQLEQDVQTLAAALNNNTAALNKTWEELMALQMLTLVSVEWPAPRNQDTRARMQWAMNSREKLLTMAKAVAAQVYSGLTLVPERDQMWESLGLPIPQPDWAPPKADSEEDETAGSDFD